MTEPLSDRSSIRTRPSLLHRLQAGDDVQGWQEFYRVYGKLIRDFALKAGLNEVEAEEVVQEVAIGVAKHLPGFSYDPKVCRFKTWLLNLTSWRIKDQFKKRARATQAAAQAGDDTRTDAMERIADPAPSDLERLFEAEWRSNLVAMALEKLTDRFTLKQIQVFDLLVVQEWPTREVARSLGISMANLYVTKHRVAAAVKREVGRLEAAMDCG